MEIFHLSSPIKLLCFNLTIVSLSMQHENSQNSHFIVRSVSQSINQSNSQTVSQSKEKEQRQQSQKSQSGNVQMMMKGQPVLTALFERY